jgi:hypothetical protein
MSGKKESQSRFKADDFLAAIPESAGVIAVIARRVGCSRATVYNAMRDFVSVRKAIEDERESMKDYAEGTLFKLIRQDNLTALIFYLKTQAKDRGYVERVEIAGNMNLNVINDAVRALEEAGLEPAEVFEKIIQRARAESEIKRDANSG